MLEKAPKVRWLPTRCANLVRRSTNGMYYLCATIGGRKVRKSLKTVVESVARARLAKEIDQRRTALAKKAMTAGTFGPLLDVHLQAVEANPALKPSTKKYHAEIVQIIRRTWPELATTSPSRLTQDALAAWADKVRAKYSATRYNAALGILRAIGRLSVESGYSTENPISIASRRRGIQGIARAPVSVKEWAMPSGSQFEKLLAALDKAPTAPKSLAGAVASRHKTASRVIRFLTYSGLRIGAARRVMPEHVDLKNGFLTKPPIKYTDTPRRLPLFGKLREVCKELLADYPGEGPLLPIKNPRKALQSACQACKLPRLHNHALRHAFATRCLESGVDVRTVADWLDHKDGGALILKRYSHLVDGHSQKMAKRVRF